jgi:hypothetical protein
MGLVGVMLVGSLSGCMQGSASQSPMSHFAFPNSNVIPIGPAEGSKSKLCGILFVNWGAPDADDQDNATREALEQTSGDLLINVRTDSKIFSIPMLFSICSTKVRGTSCKMEVGRQELSAMNPGANRPPPPRRPKPRPAENTDDGASEPPPPPPPPAPPASRTSGCGSDNDCKGGRICREGSCVNP